MSRKLLFWWFGLPVDCCPRLTLPVPLRIFTLYSLTGFLLSKFVSYRGIATKSQSIIMGSRLVDIAKISMIYLLYLAVKLVNWDRSEVAVSAGLSSQTSDCTVIVSVWWLLTGYFTDPCIERLARFSCSLPLSILLFSPTHNVLHHTTRRVGGSVWQKSWDRFLVLARSS